MEEHEEVEWLMLVDEALSIVESQEDRERRLKHLRKDLWTDRNLSEAQRQPILDRIEKALGN